ILGETGTGKGVLASWLHYNGPRHEEAFVDLNCAALSKDLLDTELFGHEKGAFTGATGDKLGLIEAAHKGTLFLDEIGDMDVQIQPKLLKVLEEKQFRRLGDVHNRSVDVRLVTATHQDLPSLVGESRFRNDLYYRVSTIKLRIPPLRERAEDIPALAEQILDSFSGDLGRGKVSLSKDAVAALRAHQWPGNIRELRNVLERGVLLSDKNVLGASDLLSETDIASHAPSPGGRQTLHEIERWHIERVLREEQGNVERAARVLGVSRSSLYMKTKQYRISGESKSWTN
ncbi:MAG TPA: sigma-54 dependent transcriptional regulator, partial [Blastocatellia bacterium]